MRYYMDINHRNLTWARERAGLDLDVAAKRIGLKNSAELTATEKLADLEAGRTRPTYHQLQRASKVYRCAYVVFFLNQPPFDDIDHVDYRAVADSVSREESALLHFLLCDFWVRRDLISEALDAGEIDVPEPKIVGTLGKKFATFAGESIDRLNRMSQQQYREVVDSFAGQVHAFLYDPEAPSQPPSYRSPTKLFDELRSRIEAAGIFVVLASDLGERRTGIGEHVFRGFTIADKRASFIVINNRAKKSTWSFALLNGLVHLFLGNTGISGPPSIDQAQSPIAWTEQFCNDVAAQVLIPHHAIAENETNSKTSDPLGTARKIAKRQQVDSAVAAYRLIREGRLPASSYRTLGTQPPTSKGNLSRSEISTHPSGAESPSIRKRATARTTNSRPDAGARIASNLATVRFRMGDLLTSIVNASVRSRAMTYVSAGDVLGIKTNHISRFFKTAPRAS